MKANGATIFGVELDAEGYLTMLLVADHEGIKVADHEG